MPHITEREIIAADTAQLYEWLADTEYMKGYLAIYPEEEADQQLRKAVLQEFARRTARNRKIIAIASFAEFSIH